MANDAVIDIFCEDGRQEAFARALVGRVALEEGVTVAVEVRSGRGGRGRATTEFTAYQRLRRAVPGMPDLLVLVVDADRDSWQVRSQELRMLVDDSVFPRVAVCVPEPEVEAWYLADAEAISEMGGDPDPAGNSHKERLRNAFRDDFLIRDGLELGRDVVEAMDLTRAARACDSLGRAVSEIRSALRRLVAERSVAQD